MSREDWLSTQAGSTQLFTHLERVFYHARWELNIWRPTPVTFHPPPNLACLLALDRSSPTRPQSTARAADADSAAPYTQGATAADAVRSVTDSRTVGCRAESSERCAISENGGVGTE
jgi:hypothetical protein